VALDTGIHAGMTVSRRYLCITRAGRGCAHVPTVFDNNYAGRGLQPRS